MIEYCTIWRELLPRIKAIERVVISKGESVSLEIQCHDY